MVFVVWMASSFDPFVPGRPEQSTEHGGGTLGGGLVLWILAQGATGGWDEGPALPLQLRFPNGCSVGESSAENRAGPCRVQTESEPEPPLKIATVARAGPGQKICTFKSTRLVLFIIAGFQQQIHRDQNNLLPCLHFPYDVFPPAPLSFKSTTHDDGTLWTPFPYPRGRSLI